MVERLLAVLAAGQQIIVQMAEIAAQLRYGHGPDTLDIDHDRTIPHRDPKKGRA